MKIEVTFPKNFDHRRIKSIIEGNIKSNSRFDCVVSFLRSEDGENVYSIESKYIEVFYLVGMTASQLIATERK